MGERRWYKYGLHAIILGSWVFWVYSWNTRICIWAFENYNLAILKNHSILTSQLFSPYASSAQSLQQSWEAAHLCICSLPSPEKGHVWLKAECPPRPSTAIPGRKGSCCACLVTGLDRRETGSAHGRSRKANAKLGWRGKEMWTWTLVLSAMEGLMMRLWGELLLISSHHSWLIQTLEYFFTSSPSIFL